MSEPIKVTADGVTLRCVGSVPRGKWHVGQCPKFGYKYRSASEAHPHCSGHYCIIHDPVRRKERREEQHRKSELIRAKAIIDFRRQYAEAEACAGIAHPVAAMKAVRDVLTFLLTNPLHCSSAAARKAANALALLEGKP